MDVDFRSWKGCVSMRMCVVFEKGERLRHLGHLDLMRTVQRSLRRAGLPVSYSKGFNPHILLNFASALSVGAIGEHEILDVRLDQDMSEEEFQNRFSPACPHDIHILAVHTIPDTLPALMSLVRAGEWEMKITDPEAEQILIDRLDSFMNQSEIEAVRKTKSGEKICNIRPAIYGVRITEHKAFHMILEATEGSACKPSMLLKAMCDFSEIGVPRVLLTRMHLLAENDEHQLVPLENLL